MSQFGRRNRPQSPPKQFYTTQHVTKAGHNMHRCCPSRRLPPRRPALIPLPVHALHPEVRPCERVSNRRVWSGCGASPSHKGKRKAGRPEAPMRPLRRCATTCQPVSFRGAKQGSTSHSGEPALCLTSYAAQLLHSSGAIRFARAAPFPPPPISFTWFSTHLLPPLTQPSFHSSCAPHSKRGKQDAQRLSHWPSADLRRDAHHALGACLVVPAPTPL